MDSDTAVEVLPSVMKVLAPVAQAGAEHYFTNQQMARRREHEKEMAERRAEGLEKMAAMSSSKGQAQAQTGDGFPGGTAGAAAGGMAAGAAVGAAAANRGGNVYDELQEIENDPSNCHFCRRAARQLQDEPLDRAQQGADELRAYMDRMEALRNADVTEGEVKASMKELTDQWEVLPDVFAGMV